MAENGSGESGYVNADVTFIVGGVYLGGGIAGWTGGDTHVFALKVRESGFDSARVNTTDGAFKSAVGGPGSIEFHGEGFYKDNHAGNSYPPIELLSDEYVRVQCTVIFDYDFIVKRDKFKASADVEDAVKWTFDGISDGIFSVT